MTREEQIAQMQRDNDAFAAAVREWSTAAVHAGASAPSVMRLWRTMWRKVWS